jgi:amino acid adenylation domain-containing protein
VVGALGILKAGGAYVPLDPDYPAERLAFMVGDAQPRVLLTQRRLAAGPPPHGAHTLYLDVEEDFLFDEPETNPDQGAGPDDLAYVIYTSGSTGRPKGVLAPHRGAVNRLAWMWQAYPFAPTEVCCQKTSLNFVDSVWEVFGPLLQGIPTVIIPDDVLVDPHRLVPALAAHHVTRIVLVPSLLRVLLETYRDLGRRLPDLHLWVSSGEALPRELVEQFYASLPDGVLLNLYGSSEVAADSTWHDTRAGRTLRAVPIGRPIANTQVYLLDDHGQPVPIGVPGELYLGGDGLARGYLHRPDLTAERFVAHPFPAVPGGRLYRTGDLARYRPDGTLEFLGRRDHQVKLRGYRIELEEIEAVLGQHPGVRQAVVVAREDAPGETRLVAYVVPAGEPAATAGELREHAKQTLPAYMIPATFVLLGALPLTPNGKVDRRALPAPDQDGRHPAAGSVAPRDMLEVQLTKIWERVLGVRSVGVRDNFFDLGGHSLLAVRLFAEMAARFGHPLPLTTIFQAPTVEGLARVLRQAGGEPEWSALVPIQPGGTRPALFCVHQHTGHLFCYRDLARHLGPDQPVYGLAARGLDALLAPWSRIEEMAAHYVKEIRALQPQGPYYLAGYCFGGAVAFEMAQQLRREGQTVGLLALIEASWAGHAHPLRRAVRRLRRRIAFERAQMGPLTAPEQLRYLAGKATLVAREQAAALLERVAARRPGVRRDVSPVERAIRRVETAHLMAIRHYVPEVYPGRLALFRHARPSARRHGDPTSGWGALATGGIDVHEIPGNRPTVVDEPDVRILAERLAVCLEAAGAARAKP